MHSSLLGWRDYGNRSAGKRKEWSFIGSLSHARFHSRYFVFMISFGPNRKCGRDEKIPANVDIYVGMYVCFYVSTFVGIEINRLQFCLCLILAAQAVPRLLYW